MDERLRERIYKHYWGYLMGVALRYVSDRHLAKSVVNDSFIKIFKHAATFVCDDKNNFNRMFKAWMTKITVRTALNELRKKDTNPFAEELTDSHPSFPKVNHQNELNAEDIMGLLDRLRPMHKTVFLLYEIEGFDHNEIGQIMGISTSSSRVYLVRAKEKLRELYRTLML